MAAVFGSTAEPGVDVDSAAPEESAEVGGAFFRTGPKYGAVEETEEEEEEELLPPPPLPRPLFV